MNNGLIYAFLFGLVCVGLVKAAEQFTAVESQNQPAEIVEIQPPEEMSPEAEREQERREAPPSERQMERRDERTPSRPKLHVAANGYSDIVRIPRHRDGHYYTDLTINRRNINVLVDTGASILALRDSDAEAVGLYPKPADFRYKVNTANGETSAALMKAKEIELGRLVVRDVEVFILPDENLGVSLLGMNVLSELGRIEIDQNELVIERSL